MIRHHRVHWFALGAATLGLAAVVGCGAPSAPPPAPPSGTNPAAPAASSTTQTAAAPVLPMAPAALPRGAKAVRPTYANRGISDWKVTPSKEGKSVVCSFRSTSGDEVHYGGLALPLPTASAFRLTVEFAQGGTAVKALFVNAQGAQGTDAGRWGLDARKWNVPLKDGVSYTWQFIPGRAVNAHFWGLPGASHSLEQAHLFVDVDPGQSVSFTVRNLEVAK